MSALILYDTTGQWGYLGELYGIMAANLSSHFGTWTAKPVTQYTSGQMASFTAVIYIGSTYDEPLPAAFLADCQTNQNVQIIWCYDNIWQLVAATPNFQANYGWNWSGFDTSSVAVVNYKGQALSRYAPNPSGIMNYSAVAAPATVLATAVRADGSTFPWAVRSRNLTYVGENPFIYMTEGDRYLAFCDLLFDALAPTTPTQHRALVRLEDIGPTSVPADITTKADYLASRGVPFGMTVFPVYTDPLGTYNGGIPQTVRLRNATAVINAIKYAQSKGGVIIQHGWTHQFSNIKNPSTGVSGDDFEFFRVTENPDHTWNFVGPVTGDSQTFATSRINSSTAEFVAARFAAPTIWTFPHYFASAVDYKAAAAKFGTRYERCLYYKGLLSGGVIDTTRYAGQYVPYVVRDVYGSKILPDNLGGVEPDPFFAFPARLPAAVIADAQRSLVVRDGFASFFCYHGNDLALLQQTVEGIQGLGYTFVSPASL